MNQYKSVTFSVNNDVPNTFLAAQMRSLLGAQYHLHTVQCFKLIHDQRKLSVSDIKRSKLKRIKPRTPKWRLLDSGSQCQRS